MTIIATLLKISLCTIYMSTGSTHLYASEHGLFKKNKSTEKKIDKSIEEEKAPNCFEGEKRVPCETQPKQDLADNVEPGPLSSFDGTPPAHGLHNCYKKGTSNHCKVQSNKTPTDNLLGAPPQISGGIPPAHKHKD